MGSSLFCPRLQGIGHRLKLVTREAEAHVSGDPAFEVWPTPKWSAGHKNINQKRTQKKHSFQTFEHIFFGSNVSFSKLLAKKIFRKNIQSKDLAYSGQHANSAMLELCFTHPVDRQGIRDAQRVEALLFTNPALQHLDSNTAWDTWGPAVASWHQLAPVGIGGMALQQTSPSPDRKKGLSFKHVLWSIEKWIQATYRLYLCYALCSSLFSQEKHDILLCSCRIL